MSRHKERNPKPDGFGLLVEKFALRRVIEISALGELGSTTGGLQTVLLDLQNLQSIALQWFAVFENQFPFKMNPVNFYHIV